MSSHNILLLGSGGRESALAWKLTQSKRCHKLFIAPGNAGTAAYGTNVSLALTDFEAIKKCCLEKEITLVFPGSEDALVAGIWDYFQEDAQLQHIIVAGPSEAGAQLEGSKAFAKQFMMRHNIPTAAYRTFDEAGFDAGMEYLSEHEMPVVLKADGLAAGKGVIICNDAGEAQKHFKALIKDAQFGAASKKVVVESFLDGIELSVFAMTDGTNYVSLPEAKDYKRIGEGDTGLNTGGMGAISPVPFADDGFMQKVKNRIIAPTIQGLKKEGIPYQGFVFFGLINVGGNPFVIEYNCRMGDPETEVVMPRLKNDLVEMIEAMHHQLLHQTKVETDERAAATVMLVSDGYPGEYAKGKPITGMENVKESLVFGAGISFKEGKPVTNGGRVVAVTSYGKNLQEALDISYKSVALIDFEGKAFRKDIGWEF